LSYRCIRSSLRDFELEADEITAIDDLDNGQHGRIGPDPDTFAWIPQPGDRPVIA